MEKGFICLVCHPALRDDWVQLYAGASCPSDAYVSVFTSRYKEIADMLGCLCPGSGSLLNLSPSLARELLVGVASCVDDAVVDFGELLGKSYDCLVEHEV